MDFASFRLGVGTSSPTHDLTVPGQAKLANLIFTNDLITSETGTIDFGSNANIKISGGATNSVLTTDGSGNLFWAESLGNVIFTGNSSFSVINANLIYEDSYRVLTTNSNIQINGDAVGSGTSSNVYVELSATGVVAGTYGSADDEYTDYVPKITVDSKGRITNIANVTLTQVGNVSFIDTTISTVGNLTLAPTSGIIYANASIIKDLSDPIDNQDAVTLSYLNSALATSATGLARDDSSLIINDDGINAAVLTTTVDGTVVANTSVLYTEFYNTVNIGNLSINDRTISSNGNIILDALGTGTVQFTGTDAVGLPSGGDATRPANPEIGYLRFNTDRDTIEYWTGTTWEVPGESYISSEVINPDGTSNVYTLSSNATNDGTLVSINGTLQQPGFSYNVNVNQITFSETPLVTDIIEVRHISVGAVTISRLASGNTSVDLTSGNIVLNSHMLPELDVTYDLGSEDLRWRDIYLSGNTINLGGMTLKNDGGVFKAMMGNVAGKLQADDPVDNADVVTLGYLNTQLSSLDSSIIISDDTSISIIDGGVSAGNIVVAVDGSNVAVFGNNAITFDRDFSVSANISAINLSANNITGLLLTSDQYNITGLGTLTSGTWSANTIAVNNGGTGATTTSGVGGALDNLLPSGEQTGYVLSTSGAGSYSWVAPTAGGATVGQQLTTTRQSNAIVSNTSIINLAGISYTPGAGQLRVYVNGVRQFPAAYTETSNVSYTLSANVVSGDTVFTEIDAFSSFNNYANLTYASNVGNISASGLTVQAAIESLETNKAPLNNPIFTNATVGGALNVGGNLSVTGNLFINGNATIINSNNLTVNDSMIYLAEENPADTLDIGITAHVVNPSLNHVGFVRDATDGVWKLFSNVSTQPTTTVNFTNATYSNIRVGNLTAIDGSFTGNITANVAGFSIGYRDLPQVTAGNVTLALTDASKHFYANTTAPSIITVPSNANVAFPIGTTIVIVNRGSGNITIQNQGAGAPFLYLAGNAVTTTSRTLTQYGMATLVKTETNLWFVNGTGVV